MRPQLRSTAGREKEDKAQQQVSVQEVEIIHFSNRARETRHPIAEMQKAQENKRSRARVWAQILQVYKESVFLYNSKKTKGYKGGCICKTPEIFASTCKQVPDQTGDKTERGHGMG